MLDAGHGGNDLGELGPAGTQEKDVALNIATKAGALLGRTCKVVMTRTEDKALSAAERATAANFGRGDLFVSIHTGASASRTANGIQLFVPGDTIITPTGRSLSIPSARAGVDKSKALAQLLAAALTRATSATSRGTHTATCRVFQGLTMPGVLVEVGFITNPTEESLLADQAYQGKIAEGVAAGIQAFLAAGN